MNTWHTRTIKRNSEYITLAGFEIQRILCAQLFREMAGLPAVGHGEEVATLCHQRWVKLADALANLADMSEILTVLSRKPKNNTTAIAFLGVGRGESQTAAEQQAKQTCDCLWTLASTILDYTQLQPLTALESDKKLLAEIENRLQAPQIIEIRRRWETLRIDRAEQILLESSHFGFQIEAASTNDAVVDADNESIEIEHLFPWLPSNDSWRRLLEVMGNAQEDSAVVVHLQSFPEVPDNCRQEARKALAMAERVLNEKSRIDDGSTVLRLQASILREHLLKRVAILEGSAIAARVFLATSKPASPALLATVKGCLDEGSMQKDLSGAESMFQGGIKILKSDRQEILAPFSQISLDCLFAPQEASAFLRTPMPTDEDLPGITIVRARTVPLLGTSGDDCFLGHNVYRGSSKPVTLEESMRFRHTYIIGQTGTGKSTLLKQMILHDIDRGRGVGVLDPHGALIESILDHYPKERADDLVLVDVTDTEYPIGFNVLRIEETDPLQYRLARDLIIDDLYSYLHRVYDLKQTGGPIFESYFRGILGLLMGSEPPKPDRIPNLMLFRSFFTNEDFRTFLCAMCDDLMLDDFVREIENTRGDVSLDHVAPYITSKFSRFVSDIALRNITCQNNILDLDAIVNQGKVLLFHLGKGRFGDQAAGLLASQIISRIRNAVMKRGYNKNNRPFYLYADEFQLFADERFAELLAESRKFRLSLTIAHQYTKQLPEQVHLAVLGNVGTTVTFRIGALDGEMLEPLYSPAISRRDLTSLPNFRCYVRSFGKLGQTPFSIELAPPPNKPDPEFTQQLKELSRSKYAKKRSEVEKEIYQTYKNMTDLPF